MKLISCIFSLILISLPVSAQSGRRLREPKLPPPIVEQPKETPSTLPAKAEPPPVTAERNQDYRCTDDGTLARILDTEAGSEQIFSSKLVDTRAMIIAQPKPSYTKEARRLGVQGFVILKVALSGSGQISRIRVVKRLPAGLTENAIRAACKLEFKPATKDGKPVSQWIAVEYVFRLADSSIFRP
jgi:protein TonB